MDKNSTSYFESDEFKELLARYEEARQKKLTTYFDPDQLTDISEYYANLGNFTEAYNTAEYALYLHPGNTDAMVVKAHLLVGDNRLEEAREIADSIQDCSDYEVLLLKAEILLNEGNTEKAENLLQEYIRIDNTEKDNLIDIAFLYLDNNLPGMAIQWFTDALNRFPGDLEIMEGLAESYFEADQPAKAIEFYNLLLDENPYSTEYWSELGKIYFTLEEFNKSIEAYEFVTAIDKESKHAILMLGHCYAKLENYPKAEAYYKVFSEQADNGNNDHSYYYLGICYYSMGEYRKAIDSFLKGIDSDGELLFQPLDIYSYIADCYAELGDKENALLYIDSAIAEDALNIDAYFSKIRFLLKFGEIQDALAVMNETVMVMPYDVPNIIEAAILFIKFEEYDSALTIVKLLEEKFPLAYHIFTGFICNSNGHPEQYREHIAEAMALSPEGFWDKVKNTPDNDGFMTLKKVLLETYENNN